MIHDEIYRRWATIYDADELKETIKKIVDSEDYYTKFFESAINKDDIFQGDILKIESSLPIIDDNDNIACVGNFLYWMILGNTCDIKREIKDVPYTQIIPLFNISNDVKTLTLEKRDSLRKYNYTRRFYIPSWPYSDEDIEYFAEFTMPVTIDKIALLNRKTEKVASLTYEGWILFHCCLVRFLARDDGRLV